MGLNDPTKTNIASLIDSYITNLTSSAAGNLNKTYIPPQNENKVVNVNTEPKNGFIPEINMWWPQTIVDKNAIAKIDAIMAL